MRGGENTGAGGGEVRSDRPVRASKTNSEGLQEGPRALQAHVSDVPLLPRSNPCHHRFIKMDTSNDSEHRGREDRAQRGEGTEKGEGDGLLEGTAGSGESGSGEEVQSHCEG